MKRFFGFLTKAKWGAPSTNSIRFCPKCGSSHIKLSSGFDIWLTPEQYVCQNCGYKGPIVLELEKQDEENQPN